MVPLMGQNEQVSVGLSGVVAKRLKATGLALDEILASLEMTRSTYYRRINGHQPFTAPELYAIAGFLGTTLSALAAEAEGVAA